jgi:hypothetical protein
MAAAVLSSSLVELPFHIKFSLRKLKVTILPSQSDWRHVSRQLRNRRKTTVLDKWKSKKNKLNLSNGYKKISISRI